MFGLGTKDNMMFVEVDDNDDLVLPSVHPKSFLPSASVAIVSPTQCLPAGSVFAASRKVQKSPSFPDDSAALARSPRSRTLSKPKTLGLNLRRIRPAAVVAGDSSIDDGARNSFAHTAATPVMRGGGKIASPSSLSSKRGLWLGEKTKDKYYRPTMLWEESSISSANAGGDNVVGPMIDEHSENGGEEVLDDGELPSLRHVASGIIVATPPGKPKLRVTRGLTGVLKGQVKNAVVDSPHPSILSLVNPHELKVAGFWSQLDDDHGDDNREDDDDAEEMPGDERRHYVSMSPPHSKDARGTADGRGLPGIDGEDASIGLDTFEITPGETVRDRCDYYEGEGKEFDKGWLNSHGDPSWNLLKNAACYASDTAMRDDASIIGTYADTVIEGESDDDQSLDRTFRTNTVASPMTDVNRQSLSVINAARPDNVPSFTGGIAKGYGVGGGVHGIFRCINDALSTICGINLVGGSDVDNTAVDPVAINTGDFHVSPTRERAREILGWNGRMIVSDGEDLLDNVNTEKVMDCDVDLPETQATIEEDTAIELQYHAADRAVGENYNGTHSLPTMPVLTTQKKEGDAKRLKKKTGIKKLLNLVGLKSIKNVNSTKNEDYNSNKPRKALIIATNRWDRNSTADCQQMSETPYLTEMYKSLTFEQEILGDNENCNEGEDYCNGGEFCENDPRNVEEENEPGDVEEKGLHAAAAANLSPTSSSIVFYTTRASLFDDDMKLESEAVAWTTNKKNTYLKKLAERAKIEHIAKATTFDVLADGAQMDNDTKAGTSKSGGVSASALSQSAVKPTTLLPIVTMAAEKLDLQDRDKLSSHKSYYNIFGPAQKQLFLKMSNSGMNPHDTSLQIMPNACADILPGFSVNDNKQQQTYVDPSGDVSEYTSGEESKEREQNDVSDTLLESAKNVLRSDKALKDGKYQISTGFPAVPTFVQTKSRSKSRESYQELIHQKPEHAALRELKQTLSPDADGLMSSGISYYDAQGCEFDPNNDDHDNSGLLGGNINMPGVRARNGKILGVAMAGRVACPGPRGLSQTLMTSADNDRSAKSTKSSKSLALNFISRRPNVERFLKLDSDLALDKVPSLSVEEDKASSLLLGVGCDNNTDGREFQFNTGEDFKVIDICEGVHSVEDETKIKAAVEVGSLCLSTPPPESTWMNLAISQTSMTSKAILSYKETQLTSPDKTQLTSPDILTSIHSPVNAFPESASNTDDTMRRGQHEFVSLAQESDEDFVDQSITVYRSNRKRHKGAASRRFVKAKLAEDHLGSFKMSGWFCSIRDAASTQGHVWDPVLGWIDYSESAIPGAGDNVVPSLVNHCSVCDKKTSVVIHTVGGDNCELDECASNICSMIALRDNEIKSQETVNTDYGYAAAESSALQENLSPPKCRAYLRHCPTDRRKITVAHQDGKLVGWKESMENAAASAVDFDGKGLYWDLEKGWVRPDETVEENKLELISSLEEVVTQSDLNQSIGVGIVNDADNRIVVAEKFINVSMADADESQSMLQPLPVTEESSGYVCSTLAKVDDKGVLGDFSEEDEIKKEDLYEGSDLGIIQLKGLNLSDDLVVSNNLQPKSSTSHFSDPFGEIELGAQEVKVVKEKFSESDDRYLFKPSDNGISESSVTKLHSYHIDFLNGLVNHETESKNIALTPINSAALPIVLSGKIVEGTDCLDNPLVTMVDSRNCHQLQVDVGQDKYYTSKLDCDAPQEERLGGFTTSRDSVPIFIPTNDSTGENQVIFRSAALGIRLKRAEDGYVRVVSVTEAIFGSSFVRDGVIMSEDMVLEAAGVNLRKPISNSLWGETVTKIRNAPRPMLFVVSRGQKKQKKKRNQELKMCSSLPPPPAKYVMESRLSKSPEGQEVLETLLEIESSLVALLPVVAFNANKMKNYKSLTHVTDTDQTEMIRNKDTRTIAGTEDDLSFCDKDDDTEVKQYVQKESLLRRIASGCVSPLSTCTLQCNQASQQKSSQLDSNDKGKVPHVPMSHLQFLRTNPTIARVTNSASQQYPMLCGRPDTIFEEPDERLLPRNDLEISESNLSASCEDELQAMATLSTYDEIPARRSTIGSTIGSVGSNSRDTAFLPRLETQSLLLIEPKMDEGTINLYQQQKLDKLSHGMPKNLSNESEYNGSYDDLPTCNWKKVEHDDSEDCEI